MPDWDADSPQLQSNLIRVLSRIRDAARRREQPTVEAARGWHKDMMQGLRAPDRNLVGKFRGEAGIERYSVGIGGQPGVIASRVDAELKQFQTTLQRHVGRLDRMVPRGAEPDTEDIAAILDLCAWTHAAWARIHPFANGNGRTARLWANSIAMRYGLPPFVSLRPRPNGDYAAAGAKAMRGEWVPTATVFRRMLRDLPPDFDGGA
jgi:fido (protein-threonine AMPylation protein)